MKLSISNESIFYIICPANYASGGPEDLHQLALALQESGKKVFMHYVNYNENEFVSPVHAEYLKFNIPFSSQFEKTKTTIFIIPETFSIYIWNEDYANTQKIIWWLSVSNFYTSLETWKDFFKQFPFFKRIKMKLPSIKNIKKAEVFHLTHSYYSVDFLTKNKIKIEGKISGYMEEMFLTGEDYSKSKQEIVTYNAIKNKEFLEEIKKRTPHIQWLPMINMTLQQVADCMKIAKVYIDFGHHPGREKMPREACLMDCCLIIGKEGSAFFKEDIPIKDEYHFEKNEKNIPLIINKIEDCLLNYSNKISDFKEFKDEVLNDKRLLYEKVNIIFGNTN